MFWAGQVLHNPRDSISDSVHFNQLGGEAPTMAIRKIHQLMQLVRNNPCKINRNIDQLSREAADWLYLALFRVRALKEMVQQGRARPAPWHRAIFPSRGPSVAVSQVQHEELDATTDLDDGTNAYA